MQLLPDWSSVRTPVIGMLHLPALPGAPRFGGDAKPILDSALRDADALAAGGVHGLMLENYGVSEGTWRAALAEHRSDGPTAPSGFAVSESPRYVGRAIAALAADTERSRWNQCSLTSGQLAREYGFTDLDGSRPDIWRFNDDVELGRASAPEDYR
jgi:hypothetical protein